MRLRHASAAAIALLVATALPARAERDTAMGIDQGFGSAVGLLGITLTRAFDPGIRIEAGVGAGFSGLQLSLMPKVALGEGRDHFVAGVGVSVALPTNNLDTDGHPVWLNVDAVGYEHQFPSGLALSFALGFFHGLGGGHFCKLSFSGECAGINDRAAVSGMWGPQTRFEVAYWF